MNANNKIAHRYNFDMVMSQQRQDKIKQESSALCHRPPATKLKCNIALEVKCNIALKIKGKGKICQFYSSLPTHSIHNLQWLQCLPLTTDFHKTFTVQKIYDFYL